MCRLKHSSYAYFKNLPPLIWLCKGVSENSGRFFVINITRRHSFENILHHIVFRTKKNTTGCTRNLPQNLPPCFLEEIFLE